MKHFAVLLVTAFLLCACSKDEPIAPVRPGVEPDTPSAPEGYPEVSFAAENTTEFMVDDENGSLHIILYRKATAGSLPYACSVELADGADFASIDNQADFAKGISTASITLRYWPSKMGSRQRSATVKISDSGKSLTIKFTKADKEWADGGRMLMFDGRDFRQIESKYRVSGNSTEWILDSGNTARHFTVADGLPEVIADGGVAAASVYGKADQWPGVGAESCFSDDFIALNVCDISNGAAAFPHTEYFFRKNGTYTIATVCDGWLLPVIAINAMLLNPEENKWRVPARLNPDGCATLFGPYHNGSPLHSVNGSELSATWHIAVGTDGQAIVAPQFSGFRNRDVFDFDFMIAAEGLCTNGLSKIIFEIPMHNCNADGIKNSTVECTWGKILPTTIEIGTSTDFRTSD